jgi:hypothetical protein
MTLTIFDAVEIFDKDEFLSYLKRLEDKLYEAWIPVIATIKDSKVPGEDVLKRYDELKDTIRCLGPTDEPGRLSRFCDVETRS